MSKHLKMYITINDIIGKKTIDLSYPIYPNAGRGEAKKEIAVVSMFSNNSQILLQKIYGSVAIHGQENCVE